MTNYHQPPPPNWQNWPPYWPPTAPNGIGKSLDRIEAQTASIREDTKSLRAELETAKRWIGRGAMVFAWFVISGLNLSKEQMVEVLRGLIRAVL